MAIRLLDMAFAENLKKLMEDRNISPKVLSDATGIPRSSLGDWLSGTDPRLNESIVKLSRFFGCSIDYLMTGEEPESDLLKEIFSNSEDDFTEIHSGIYRLRIDKILKKE